MFLRILFLVFIHLFLFSASFSQVENKMVVHKDTICLNELLSLSIDISDTKERNIGSFPEIPELLKRRTTYEKRGKHYKVTQYYQPTKQGVFSLPSTGIYVNGRMLYSDTKKIKILPVCKNNYTAYEEGKISPYEDVKEDAFFRLEVSKATVYPGEIFELSAAFLVAKGNKAEMNFIDFDTQMKDLAADLRLQDFWVEGAGFPEQPILDSVVINDKKYNRYVFFNQKVSVLKEGKIKIAPFSWKMIKYKVSRNKRFIDRKDTLIVFKSSPLLINVRPLPAHPLKDKIPVGVFRISETLDPVQIETGEKTILKISIKGKEAWPGAYYPILNHNKNLEFYMGEITSKKGKTEWERNFSFYIIPSRKGDFLLSDYLYWISFNPETGIYDTLKPTSILKVKDESFAFKEHVTAYQKDEFYQQLEKDVRKRDQYNYWEYIKYYGNIFIILLAVGTLALIIRK